MMLSCNNQGCRKLTEATIDPDTNQVFCEDCNKEIIGVTDFIKRQMIFSKQVRKANVQGKPFCVECKKCKKTDQPMIKNHKAFCKNCKSELTHITQNFILAFESIGKSD